MEATNLWGDLGLEEPVKTPTEILKEQAVMLTSLTNGILNGSVSVEGHGKHFDIILSIIAPAIGGYKLDILRVEHDLNDYPVEIINLIDDQRREHYCSDEQELLEALGKILGSEQIRRIIRSLVAQSRAV